MIKELNVCWYGISKHQWLEAKYFYEAVLGFKPVFGSDDMGWIEYKIEESHTTALAISRLQEGEKVVVGGATAVLLVDDIEKAINELKKEDVPIIGDIYADKMVKLIRFEDPCGNQLQLVQVLAQEG